MTDSNRGETSRREARILDSKESGSELASILCYPATLFGAIALLISLLGCFPIFWGELCSNLRAQLIIVLLACMIPPLFSTPKWRLLYVFLVPCFGINLWLVAGVLMPKENPAQSNALTELKFKVVEMEIDKKSTDLSKVLAVVKAEWPAIVCFTNVTESAIGKLKPALQKSNYKYSAVFPRNDGYGLAVFSLRPLEGSEIREIKRAKIPVLVTRVKFDFGPVRVIALKMPDTESGEGFERRTVALDSLSQLVSGSKTSTVVAGSFNMTPYRASFEQFVNDAGLKDTRRGSGVHPNCYLPRVEGMDFWINRFPMDHIFVSSRLATLSRRVGDSLGSSTRPVIAELYPASIDSTPQSSAPIKTDMISK